MKNKNIEFNHFILTRFNLRAPWTHGDPDAHLGLDEGWLERRFELFEKVCLPSLVRQTETAFQWLLLLDHETPERFVKRMEEWSFKYPFFNPIYLKKEDEALILKEMNERTNFDHTRIMTRLDNDDAIRPRMIENIQSMARKYCQSNHLKRGFFISFPMGYSENLDGVYLQRFRYNPFASFVSSSDYQRTILYWDHTKITDVAPVYFKYTWPMWCQVIHDENVANTIRGIYLPWGGRRNLATHTKELKRRSFAWQCAEVWRSFKYYLFGT